MLFREEGTSMLRIGEAAKKYDISNRTLRYWEEMGILKSIRTENGYRYYDDENAARINQIALLRKLKMPIADIERVFIADDSGVASETLSKHLDALKQAAVIYDSLIAVVEKLITRIRDSEYPEQVFLCIETQENMSDSSNTITPQILLSERVISMSKENLSNVRIVKLPAMTVAAYRAESAVPEADCSKVFNKFVLENSLHKRDGYRFFGFNDPSPSDGTPVYGYEMWVTIPEEFDVPEPLIKKKFDGGLYASISTQMNEIGERWRLLYDWCEDNNEYDTDFSFRWLEECTMDFETFVSDKIPDSMKQLDLLEPIKHKVQEPGNV